MSQEITNKANPTKERFLFCFTPSNLALTAPCGCSLQTGSQLVALIFITFTLTPFYRSLQFGSIVNILYFGIIFALYFFAGVSVLYSTYTYVYEYAHTGNFIYNFLFVLNFLDIILVAYYIFTGYYLPLGIDVPSTTQGLYYMAASFTILLIEMYMIWIVFCFMVHIKNGRNKLVQGLVYKTYEDFNKENETINRA